MYLIDMFTRQDYQSEYDYECYHLFWGKLYKGLTKISKYTNVNMALTGSVTKWFNRKGFGFINVVSSDNEHTGNDLFVHLSGINVSNDGYKCLYPGEYVSFDLGSGRDGRPACVNVTGVLGGPLLTEHPDYRYKYFSRVSRKGRDDQADDAPSSTADTGDAGANDGDDGEDGEDENDPEQQ